MRLSELVEYLKTLHTSLGDAEVVAQEKGQNYDSAPRVRDLQQINHRLLLQGSLTSDPANPSPTGQPELSQRQVILVFDEKTRP